MATVIEVGKPAPAFSLPASNGKTVSLKDFKGKKRVILYFYPKDDTPGCTIEACGFRDKVLDIEHEGAVVLGVSPDGLTSHNKFIEKFNLPFLLLSDETKKTCKDYNVWIKKKNYGKEYMGVARKTFIIGKDGTIQKVYDPVKPEGHQDEVLTFLKESS